MYIILCALCADLQVEIHGGVVELFKLNSEVFSALIICYIAPYSVCLHYRAFYHRSQIPDCVGMLITFSFEIFLKRTV